MKDMIEFRVACDPTNKSPELRREIARAAKLAMGSDTPWTSAIELEVTFYLARPYGHLRSNGQLKPTAPKYHATEPSPEKLFEYIKPALKGIVYRLHGQAAKRLSKNYGMQGVFIRAWKI